RVAAYEALVARAEAVQLRRLREQIRPSSAGAKVVVRDEPVQSAPLLELGGDTLQGGKRRVVEGKFVLGVVPSGGPLGDLRQAVVYVTQRGRPRIVLFGEKLELNKPAVVSAWADRLMLACDSMSDDFRVRYKTRDRIDDDGDVVPGFPMAGKAPSDVSSLVEF